MIRKWFVIFLMAAGVFVFFPFSTAKADGIIIPEPPFPVPMPLSQLDIRYHHVNVVIQDQIAVTRVDQVFHNPNDWTVEGTYIFPIPKGAVVTNFKLWIDGQAVEGQVLSAEEARRTYEEIVRQLVDPALLEYVDQGAVQARIFPIEPGDERRIELEYSQVLAADNGLVRYTYPLNTEKFSRIPLEEVSVSVDIQAASPIRAVYSPSHNIGISRDGDLRASAGYEEVDVTPDTDFVLYYSLGESEALHLLTFRNPDDPTDPDGFYLLLLAPRPDAAEKVLAKDVLIVIDQSGSMEGEKYRQAQDAAVFILEHLNQEDHFNVITFSTGLQTYATGLRTVDEAPAAVEWVRTTAPAGSTDINRALLDALAMTNNERPTFLLFLTDGQPTSGEIDTQRILDNFGREATENIRLFAFGVGYDVDTILLDSLAQSHHGTTTYVVPGERIDEAVSGFYQKVSTPVLTDLELQFDGVTTYDPYPNPLPDLFVGSQIVTVGRYRMGGRADITLTGIIDGELQEFAFSEQVFAAENQREAGALEALPRLWATRKIGYLLNRIRLDGPDQETIDQIVKLSIRYGIVTPYTSYLVTEPIALGAEAQRQIADDAYSNLVEAPAPAASGQEAVQKAADQGGMAEAEVIAAPPAEIADQVRVMAGRTFLFTEGKWVDTAYDPENMETIPVPFLSNDYFALISAKPELGPPFSLGDRVIAFADGAVYEVVSGDIKTDPIDIPKPTATDLSVQQQPTDVPEISSIDATQPSVEQPVEPDKTTPSSGLPCLGGLLPLLILPLFGYMEVQKHWKKRP